MAKNKKQHYVPQFLLRNFHVESKDRCIALFNVRNNIIIPIASISDQACKDYFYAKESIIEELLSKGEYDACMIIRDLIKTETIPHKADESYSKLLNFIAIQRCRTSCFMDNAQAIYQRGLTIYKDLMHQHYPQKHFDKIEINVRVNRAKLLFKFSLSAPLLSDLEIVILKNQTETPFVISDDPVVSYNPLLFSKFGGNSEGLCLIGLCIFLPLSPNICLLMYDKKYYGVRHNNDVVIVESAIDVINVNILQILNAQNQIFTNRIDYLESIKECYHENLQYKVNTKLEDKLKPKTLENIYGETIEGAYVAEAIRHNRQVTLSFLKRRRLVPTIRCAISDLIRNNALLSYVENYTKYYMSRFESNDNNNNDL